MSSTETEILKMLRAVRQSLHEMLDLAKAAAETYEPTDTERDRIQRAESALERLEAEIRVRE